MRIDVENILRKALELARDDIRDNLASTGTNASGRTSASLKITIDGNTATLWGRPAFGTVETGRRGGRVPKGFRHIIYQWMQDKGVHATITGNRSQQSADMSMAYLIARKIQREGSKLYRQGGRSDIYSNVLPTTIERIEETLNREFIFTINSILRWQ